MNEIKTRLLAFIEHLGLSTSAFERECTLGNGFVNKIGKTITKGSLNMIVQRFPELNTDWLINNRGDMLVPISDQVSATGSNALMDLLRISGETNRQLSEANSTLTKTNKMLVEENLRLSEQLDRIEKILSSKDGSLSEKVG